MIMILQRLCSLITVAFLLISLPLSAFAHSGRTDSSGGHKDNKNKSGLGSYHYHCGGYPPHLHDGGYCPYTDILPSGVRVNAEKTTLKLGEKVSISGSVYPENAVNTSVSWNCSDESVIKLSNGYIEAVGYGTAMITGTSFNDKVGTVRITVQEVAATSISIDKPADISAEIYIGNTLSLAATITPSDVDNPQIVWTSSDNNIANVSEAGMITPLAAGNVIISAVTSNGIADAVEITVLEKVVESVEIENGEELELLLEDTGKLSAVVLPADASFPGIVWASDKEDVLLIDKEGNVVARSCGTAHVTATASNGVSDSITVNVTEVVADRLEIRGERTVKIGSELDLEAIFYPADTTIQRVEWSTSADDIASVDENGHVTTYSLGTVTVYAVAKDVEAELLLEVEPILVERIVLRTTVGEKFKAGDEADFSAAVYPQNATYPEVVWSTSNPKVAVIDSDGHLVAESFGKVTVIAETGDGFIETYDISVSMSDRMVGMIAGGSGVASIAGLAMLVMRGRRKKHQQ